MQAVCEFSNQIFTAIVETCAEVRDVVLVWEAVQDNFLLGAAELINQSQQLLRLKCIVYVFPVQLVVGISLNYAYHPITSCPELETSYNSATLFANDVDDTDFISALAVFLTQVTHLKVIKMVNTDNVSHEVIRNIATHQSTLHTLVLANHMPTYTLASFKLLFSSLKTLFIFSITAASEALSDADFLELFKTPNHIGYFGVSFNNSITTDTFLQILRDNEHIECSHCTSCALVDEARVRDEISKFVREDGASLPLFNI